MIHRTEKNKPEHLEQELAISVQIPSIWHQEHFELFPQVSFSLREEQSSQ